MILDDLDHHAGPAWEPVWDARLAVELIGKRVLVGVPDPAPDGASGTEQGQLFGYAIRADRSRGIALRLGGARAGEEIMLPPDTRAFRPAAPGEYRLRGTGELVKDPDFFATWPAMPARSKPRLHGVAGADSGVA